MKLATIFLLAVVLMNGSLRAPSDTEGAEWNVENLGTNVNSPHNERFPTISPSGLSLYFASDRPGGLGDAKPGDMQALDIYVCRRRTVEDPWDVPRSLGPGINSASSDHSVTISHDGLQMFFASDRPGGCGMTDIYMCQRQDPTDDFAWSEPVNLGCVVNSPEHDACPFYDTREENGPPILYLVSNSNGGRMDDFDIYVCELDPATSEFGSPGLMKQISSPLFDGHFDPLEGLIWSSREGGLGKSDLWVTSQNSETGDWSTPINMGSSVNTVHDEEMPTVSPDGATLYFPSDRPGGSGGFDLYAATHREN